MKLGKGPLGILAGSLADAPELPLKGAGLLLGDGQAVLDVLQLLDEGGLGLLLLGEGGGELVGLGLQTERLLLGELLLQAPRLHLDKPICLGNVENAKMAESNLRSLSH